MTEFFEDRDLKKQMSRNNWRKSKLGHRCRIATLLLVLAAPLCALAVRSLMVSTLRPWEYDEAGLLGISLSAGCVTPIIAIAVWGIGYQRVNSLTYSRVGQQAALEWPWLTYCYRTKGDEYHGTGGWHHVVAKLDAEGSQVGWDESEHVMALRGDVRWRYVPGTSLGPTPDFESMEPLSMILIADCLTPSLYGALHSLTEG